MSIAGRIRYSAVCLAGIVAATLLAGCGGVARFDLAAADRLALERVNDIKIEVTTLSGVANETYPEAAWLNVQRSRERPYKLMTMGQIFEWKYLDEFDAQEATYVATARGKKAVPGKADKPKARKKPAKSAPQKEAKTREPEPPTVAEPETEEEPAASEPQEEEAPQPRRRRRR
jgi:hypothetical protein